MPNKNEAVTRAVRSCYSTWSDSYYEEYYGEDAPYPPVHTDLIRSLLQEAGARDVLDAGCGPASFLRDIVDLGIDLYGFDLTPEMVEEARRILGEKGIDQGRIWEGSVLDRASFDPPDEPGRQFDASVCVGVLPHIPESSDQDVISNLRESVKPGGLVVLEARNQLFSLFTLNRPSWDFFRNELIPLEELQEAVEGDEREALDAALSDVEKQFRTDLPPIRKGKAGEPGYDEVLSRTHNPLVLKEQFAEAGFRDVRLLFYHFHVLPPLASPRVPELFRRQSVAMEKDPEDWRGHFMASAFLLAGRRA